MSKEQKPSLAEWTCIVLMVEGLSVLVYFWIIQINVMLGNLALEATAAIMLILSLIVLLKTSSYFPKWVAWGGLTLSLSLLISYYFGVDFVGDRGIILPNIVVMSVAVAFIIRLGIIRKREKSERVQRDMQELEATNRQMEQQLGGADKAKQLDSASSLSFDEHLKPDKVKQR